jgi:hypothetical protein
LAWKLTPIALVTSSTLALIASSLKVIINPFTEVAVEAVVKAVSYQGTAKTVGLSVTNNTGLKMVSISVYLDTSMSNIFLPFSATKNRPISPPTIA